MLLLQVADIHFRHPDCETEMDRDRPYRTELLRDVRTRVARLGAVDAILVGGDIAFRGIAQEYKAALDWLKELADASGCRLERVFVVPGNHDVDRDVIRREAAVRNAQRALAAVELERRARELMEQFRDHQAGPALLAPLAAYNDFAARFDCQVYAPERLFWRQKLPLEGTTTLCIYGLTSTLLSGAGAPRGQDETREDLYLSPLQTVLDPVDDVVNVVMSHHPPDWFADHEDVEDAVRGRAEIHFFGHKHRQRVYFDNIANYARFAAGAVNPDREEPGWEPGYNLIKLAIRDSAGARHLDIEARLLAWQTNPDRFRPKLAHDDQEVFTHSIRVRGRPKPGSSGAPPAPPPRPEGVGASVPVPSGPDVEVAMSESRTRNLVFRFWNLASSQRREIAFRLKLITDEDMELPEPERYGRALMRASERRMLEQVAEELERLERA